MNERQWKILLAQMAGGLVVPVLGPQLATDGNGVDSLQADLAQRLRQRHDLDVTQPLPRFRELNAAISEIKALRSEVKLQDVYGDVCELIRELSSDPRLVVPLPIRQLAEITDFRLFVTLTPDDLLARALRSRVAVNEIVHSPYLPTSEKDDLPLDWQERTSEVQLLYLFGKASMAPQFAIHDEDVLEYAHNVISRGSHWRERFFGELRGRNLLLLGSNFPDWLGRFFLRATNKNRLMGENNKRDWLIEEPQADNGLTLFLRSFSRDTEVLTGSSPAKFVAELHQRWTAARASAVAPVGSAVEEPGLQGAVFFVSYSRSTDQAAATAFVAWLRVELKLSVREIWYDRQAIEPGDRYGHAIFDGIKSCHYFVPLVSRASDALAEKFFRREWKAALERETGIMGQTFVVPQIVDADYDPQSYVRVPPPWMEGLDFGHSPGGVPDARTAGTLKRLLRAVRSLAGEPA
ncbi:toll/interleukin-1 receptor domain-containing protein [Paucibacter sp. B51]|uniref:toll/interleukin-1 receptor domain-containing protein n=1 Tax=Paucibacter sp. B51 TaxID=2993315 RepID=UPI0022EBC7DE|nr:toll/interleukin-1 receptor domain-containing protein [Paucibacter sp. B51]